MESLNWTTILTAIGASSLLSLLMQHMLSNQLFRKKTQIQERKEAFIGLLEAWRDQEQEGVTNKNKFEVGHWILRCELVGSNNLRCKLRNWNETQPGSSERSKALKELKNAMRKDLL